MRNKMSNLYESSSYNIVSVFKSPEIEDDHYVIKIQRLPTSVYPELTEIFLTTEQVDPDLSQSDWITQVVPFIDSELSSYDSAFSGSPSNETDVTPYTQMFV